MNAKWEPRGCPIVPEQTGGMRHVCPEHPYPPSWWARLWTWLRRRHGTHR
jgi:hypothetical protein